MGTQRAAQAAYRDYLRRWADSGARVAVLQDQVVPDRSVGRVPECLAAADGDVDACSWQQDQPVPSDPTSTAGWTPWTPRRASSTTRA